MTFTYIPERWYHGADVTYMDGSAETIAKGITILVEGVLVDADDYGREANRARFIPWIHIRELAHRP